MIDKAMLLKDLEDLVATKQRLVNDINALGGAIQFAKMLLTRLETGEQAAKQDPTSSATPVIPGPGSETRTE